VDIREERTEHGAVLVAEVQPYAVPPVLTLKGVARVRSGTTTRKATDAELQRLRERRPENSKPFDIRGIGDASLDEIDTTDLARAHDEAQRDDDDPSTFPSFEAWLVRQDLGRFVDRRLEVNATAILMYGKDPQRRFPGAYIDLVRYAGVDLDGAPVDRLRATGTLPNQLEVMRRRLAIGIVERPTAKQGIFEGFEPEYPVLALEELLRNMVQHRAYDVTNAPSRIEWFDDRIVFTNPGGPYGQATVGEFGEHSDYRNPTLTKHLVLLGAVQQLGRGVRRVRSLLSKYGHPELEVDVDGYTRVTVRRRA
jgi:ATP-dependent DNA helicase RecG